MPENLNKQPYPPLDGNDVTELSCEICGGYGETARGYVRFQCDEFVGAHVLAEQQRIVGIVRERRNRHYDPKVAVHRQSDKWHALDDLLAAIKERPDHA